MRIVIVGQQAFGKAVLEAFIARGDEVAGVFAAPERPGARPDPLVAAAQERGLTVHRFARYSSEEAKRALADLKADLGVMAYVLLFAPPEFCAIPKHGMIQFHPSLLPLHRGASSIPWAIIRGRTETGLSIFRPTPGLDEGPVILQKRVAIGPDDTAGSLYFDKIFPLGVSALVEAADLVVSGRATESTQDESRATYEGWVREAESHINWANHVDFVYDLIRGCNPAPGAWTNHGARKLYLFDARKIVAANLRHGARPQDRRGGLGRRPGDADPRARRLRRGLAGTPRRRPQDQSDRSRRRGGNNPRRDTRDAPFALEQEVRPQRAVNGDVLACRGLPAEVASHRPLHHALPDSRWRNKSMARPAAAISACGLSSSKAKPVAMPSARLAGIGVDHGVGEAADPTNQRQSSITQRIELGQTAGLEARGYEDHVGAADDQMRQALVVADLDPDLPLVLLGRGRKAALEIGVAGAEQRRAGRRPPRGRAGSARTRSRPFCGVRRLTAPNSGACARGSSPRRLCSSGFRRALCPITASSVP